MNAVKDNSYISGSDIIKQINGRLDRSDRRHRLGIVTAELTSTRVNYRRNHSG
jgi:hypothetical protein